jgi:ankyrin repeat protein
VVKLADPAGGSHASRPASCGGLQYGFLVAEPLTEAELDFLRSVLDLARDGDTSRLVEALDTGVPANLTSSSGDSLLILAAYHNHPDTVRELLDRGADTGRVNDRGQTALGAAVFRRCTENVTALLAAGADPALGARSALDIARFFELPDMVALLTTER